MDIHKPKPVRSWRDLLTEVGVIVLSVCIALSAEQAVEWAHWHNEVSIARKELRAEITEIDRFYVRFIAIMPCVNKQGDEASAILDALEAGKTPPRFTVFHRGFPPPTNDSDWQSERSSQVLTHFPRTELALMGRFYSILPGIGARIVDANAAWSDLSILQKSSAGLGQAEIARLRGRLDSVRYMEYIVMLNSYRMLKLSDQLGIAQPQEDKFFTTGFCTMSDDCGAPACCSRQCSPEGYDGNPPQA